MTDPNHHMPKGWSRTDEARYQRSLPPERRSAPQAYTPFPEPVYDEKIGWPEIRAVLIWLGVCVGSFVVLVLAARWGYRSR